MKKLYKNRRPSTNILVTIDGAVRSIEFTPDVIFDWGLRGCSYITEDKAIQEAIERHPFFSENAAQLDRIWTDDVEPVKEEPKAKAVEMPAQEEPAAQEQRKVSAASARRYKGKKEE